jgi:hypothetical protein
MEPEVDLELTILHENQAFMARLMLRSSRLQVTEPELIKLQKIAGPEPQPGPYDDRRESR